MQSGPNNKDCHIFSCMEAIMQKCISVVLNHIHTRTRTRLITLDILFQQLGDRKQLD